MLSDTPQGFLAYERTAMHGTVSLEFTVPDW